MKLSRLIGDRYKEKPSGCVLDSHVLMVRGGYVKNVAGGLFSQYLPLRRITAKIEKIIREEIEAVGGQEVLLPVVLPASLWEESGRYADTGKELLRFSDRNDSPMLLAMTHEEAAVQLVREYGQSYAKYPFMIYQIQTKFRDEARPRGGLIRVREFIMNDAYSFHASKECMEDFYAVCAGAYRKIFKRVGLRQVVEVPSDTGMMGGDLSHGFILLSEAGEDSIAVCSACGYSAGAESAECVTVNEPRDNCPSLELTETPDVRTIDALCSFFSLPRKKTCKAVVYQTVTDGRYIALFLRGDLEASLKKLENHLKEQLKPADLLSVNCLSEGYIGPVGLKGEIVPLFDRSLRGAADLVCGANIPGYHYTGLDVERDCGCREYHDFAAVTEGGICPGCGENTVGIYRGIEIGNIFQLGTKYTRSMGMRFTDRDGNMLHPYMGCYGIGIGRLAAAICEANHDDNGPVWPLSVAPWQVHICCIRPDEEEIRGCADGLYRELLENGFEVIYDDRSVNAGVMFSDADLIGAPVRITVSPRNLKEGRVEIAKRDRSIVIRAAVGETADTVKELMA